MEVTKQRAAIVSVRDGLLLVIRRVKHGRRYAVLPGGGVELNECAQEAALRELHEETGLRGRVIRHLWTLEHGDRTADYFLVDVPVGAMMMSGPEVQSRSLDNTYEPCWVRVSDLDAENLQPDAIRALIRELAGAS